MPDFEAKYLSNETHYPIVALYNLVKLIGIFNSKINVLSLLMNTILLVFLDKIFLMNISNMLPF